MQHSISCLIASPWISYVYRSLLALVVAVALTATPTPSPEPSPSNDGGHGAVPQVNWNK
ncbi:MAG TPA: hypothetical protein VGJ87_03240 [Roseiflexaceae bacterium]|jgi:hypothetical protein